MDIENRTMRKVMWHLMPLVLASYFVAYLDRVNISFAALQMNKALHLSATEYGFGAGLFFITYVCCEIPSNLMMYRFGASRWIARIMLTWGLCAIGMAFIQGAKSYYLGRGLLGVAEAGFNPGLLFYFTLWFPTLYRARVIGYLYAAVPLSFVIGAPISGLLLNLDGLVGFAGWQWMFVIEGLPAVLLAGYVLFRLYDRPAVAPWLSSDERNWLENRLAQDAPKAHASRKGVLAALIDIRVPALGVVYFADVALNNAISFFLPQIVKEFGVTNTQTGLISAIPGLVAMVFMLFWSRRSDKHGERKWHTGIALFVGGLGLVAAALVHDPILRVIALTVTYCGSLSFTTTFWTIPGTYFTGAAAAGGLAAISSIGILGGAVAPWLIGYLKDVTGTFAAGQIVVGLLGMVMAIGLVILMPGRRPTAVVNLADSA